ncbi:MAG: septum formation initiator family protein [Eubacteriales bacterium]|nr:septum formation initiator family protein [Eubacteriales bacterium]
MRRRIGLWPVVAVILCMVGAFMWQSSRLERSMDEVSQQYEQSRVKLSQLQSEQATLQLTLENVDTDAFIENRARTEYGYMKPDEIRFVITNPEALYGTDNAE